MSAAHLQLLDWRRRVAALYAEVRTAYADDPVAAHTRWRQERDELFAGHPCSPLPAAARAAFTGLAVAPYDPGLAFTVPVDTDVEAERFEVAASTGTTMTYERVGAVDLPVGRLELLWLDDYAGGLFLSFTDATSGDTTYGGGRYVLDTPKGADLGSSGDGRLIVDLNFAYHPSCHYDPAWACPLPHPANRLETAIHAGELAFEPATGDRA